MNSRMFKPLVMVAAMSMVALASADEMDGPGGIHIGDRLTLRPYVSISYTFDSNVDSGRHASNSSSWSVNPGMNISYKGGNWSISGQVYYRYHAYSSGYSSQLNNSSYGESLNISYNGVDDGRGWSLTISENYAKTCQDDSLLEENGRGLGRDRSHLNLSGALSYRFNERFHANVHGALYWLDYDNDVDSYAPLYGWSQWSAGGQLGYTLSQWTDLFVSGTYHGYTQDNDTYLGGEFGPSHGGNYSGRSSGSTVHIGIRSYMTERITYSVSGGWSRFDYADGRNVTDGFTYQANLQWSFAERWRMMLMARSYFHPSEREYGSSTRSDYVSWGINHSMIEGKFNATFDVAYRHEKHEYVDHDVSDYNLDILTFRLGLNYTFNRYLGAFAHVEYQTEFNDGTATSSWYDYDRWRLSVGLRFAY